MSPVSAFPVSGPLVGYDDTPMVMDRGPDWALLEYEEGVSGGRQVLVSRESSGWVATGLLQGDTLGQAYGNFVLGAKTVRSGTTTAVLTINSKPRLAIATK